MRAMVHRKYSGLKGEHLPVFLLGLLLFLNPFNQLAQNTNMQKYDLYDPRNPDCPCHQLQKQAEKEYALLNKKVDDTVEVKAHDAVKIPDRSIVSSVKKNDAVLKVNSHGKLKRVIPYRKKNHFKLKQNDAWPPRRRYHNGRKDITLCFKW